MNDQHRPRVSFAIPVYNAERHLATALDSILVQTMDDLEVVVSDNASTDGTPDLVRDYARDDARVRYLPLEHNAGQIANFNRVLERSRGTYVRWMGADDWVEADYAQRAAAALDGEPDAVLVTTGQGFVDEAGHEISADEPARGPHGPDPVNRLAEMLRLLNTSHLDIDPIYSMMRRSAVDRTGLLRRELYTDQVLAIELAVLGPFAHVPDLLSHRRMPDRWIRPHEQMRRYGVSRTKRYTRTLRLCALTASFIGDTDLDPSDRRRALGHVAEFYVRRHGKVGARRLRRLAALGG